MDEIGPATLNVVTDSAACSNTTGAPHEYFYQSGISLTSLIQDLTFRLYGAIKTFFVPFSEQAARNDQ
jgi:hypothetical protein